MTTDALSEHDCSVIRGQLPLQLKCKTFAFREDPDEELPHCTTQTDSVEFEATQREAAERKLSKCRRHRPTTANAITSVRIWRSMVGVAHATRYPKRVPIIKTFTYSICCWNKWLLIVTYPSNDNDEKVATEESLQTIIKPGRKAHAAMQLSLVGPCSKTHLMRFSIEIGRVE